MAVVKTVSFQQDVLDYGLRVSDELFGGNFSIFITYLICCYRKNEHEANFRKDGELGEELKGLYSGIRKNFKY